jgi:hypothetical protein
LNILHGVALAADPLIVAALLWNANSSRNIALYVHDLLAFGLADSHVIAHVLHGLAIVIYLLYSVHAFLLNHLGNIHCGRLLIINLAFSNNDLISHGLSTSVSFCDIQ